MTHLFFLLFFLTNFCTSALCHTKCKEYLIIIKETSCPTNQSIIREPIKLDDVKSNHDNCSEDSLKILSNNESYSNKSYVIKFDYIGFESICVPIIKSTKLLDYIKIDDENITTHDNKEFGKDGHVINKTSVIENNTTKTYPLECLIKNYKQTCDKKESMETLKNEIKKTVDIKLIHASKPTSNITEFVSNNTEASILFENCVLNDYLCTSSNTIDDYTENNDTILQITMKSIEKKNSAVSSIKNTNVSNFNCTNIINKHKDINNSHIKALTNSILIEYYCQDEKIDKLNQTLPIFDVSVFISIDLNILNTKLRSINCTENFKHKNSTALSIECNVNESVEMHTKNDYYTTASSNISLPEIDLFERDFNQSLVYHCKLKKVNITRESYSEILEMFNTYEVFDYQTCTKEYSTDDKNAYLDGSKVLIISSEVHKENFTNSEDFGSNADSKSLKLHFLHNNVSDCSERIPLNISKGRIISQRSDEEKELLQSDYNSTLFKLVITNCDNYNTKSIEKNENNLELDIILTTKNSTRLHSNETKVNKLKNTLLNFSNRALLYCGYFNENTQLYNNKSVMECIFLETNNDNITTTVGTPTSKSPIENKNVHLSGQHNDSFNIPDKGINTTKNSTALSIDSNLNGSVEMHLKKDNYTTASGNISLPEIDLFEGDFNQSLVYHCKLKKVNITRENYSEISEIFNTYEVFDYQTCTKEYSTDDKNAYLDGSKVLIISSEVHKENFTNSEDFGSNADSKSLKLHFLHNNVSDCSERIPLNISKGRIISQRSDEEKEFLHSDYNSTLFKLVITNCDNYDTKSIEKNENNLELDIILTTKNSTRLHSNETKVNKLKNTLLNFSNRALLYCGYFNENTQLYNNKSVMECIFLETNNDNITTTVGTPTSKSPIENKNVHLSGQHNDSFNIPDKGINTTKNSTALSIDSNLNGSVEMHLKKDNYTTASGNISLPEIDLFEGDFNQSLVYHCKLKKVNITRENYSEISEIFNTYEVFDYQTCTKEYSTDDKNAYLDGSKVLIISSEVHKENFTNSEDFGSNADSKSLKLHFLHNNVSDCSERIPLNISKGRIISQRSDEEKEFLHSDYNSTLFKLVITNCDNYDTKSIEKNENNLELDIILTNKNSTRLHSNETKVNKLKNTLLNFSNRALLYCGYFNENTQLYNNKSVMECIFLETNNDNITTTVGTPTSKSPIENKNVHLSGQHNDSFNIPDKGINTTKNSTALSIDSNLNGSVEMHLKKDNYTTASGNISLPEIDLFEGDFNQSLVYHCKLKKVNITRENYSEISEIFNTYEVFDYQTCTKEYSTDDKNAYLDGSKVLIISSEVHKENFTNSEDFGSNADSKSLKLHFLHNNVSDCSERIPLNISKGRIISQRSDEEKEFLHSDYNSTLFKLVITNCDNYDTKSIEKNENNLELDIILTTKNSTRLHSNETKVNKLKNTLLNFSNRALLYCGYFNENTQLYNNKSVMECIFLETNNDNITTTVGTPTSKSPIENKNVHLSGQHNDSFNIPDKGINTTKNSTALSIDSNLNGSVEMHLKKDNYTTASGNISLPEIDLFEGDFNQSLVYHCKLKKVNITRENYSEISEIFNTYEVFDYQTCTKEYSTDDKNAYLDGSKVLIISSEVHKENFTNSEDFGSNADSKSLKLHFLHNNVSDCSERIPLNISKGRIISQRSDEEKELLQCDYNSTLFKLVITNCDNYNTKSIEKNENNLELDIILTTKNSTRLHSNETKVNNLKNTLLNFSNRALLYCGYFNENTQLYNNKSVMECIFLETNNDNITTTVGTPTSKSPIENKNVHLSGQHNNSFNVLNNGINTTTKTPKENHFSNEQESKDEGKIRNVKKSPKGNVTTETNTSREKGATQRNQTEENDPLQEMYYVSPRVYTIAVVSLLAVVGSVLIYALCLFKKKEHKYQPTPTRDWSEMEATEF